MTFYSWHLLFLSVVMYSITSCFHDSFAFEHVFPSEVLLFRQGIGKPSSRFAVRIMGSTFRAQNWSPISFFHGREQINRYQLCRVGITQPNFELCGELMRFSKAACYVMVASVIVTLACRSAAHDSSPNGESSTSRGVDKTPAIQEPPPKDHAPIGVGSNEESGTLEAAVDTLTDDEFYRYRMNDDAGAQLRIGCIGRIFPARDTFVQGGCAVLVPHQHVVLRYVAGDQALAYIPPEEDVKSTPSFVDFYKADHTMGLDELYIPETPNGELLRHRSLYSKMLLDPSYIPTTTDDNSPSPRRSPQLGADWSDTVFDYKSGVVDGANPGLYVAVDRQKGDRLTFQCRGQVIPRFGKQSIVLNAGCPSLDSEETGLFHLFVPVLTTNDNHLYYYGVANDAELVRKAYYLYQTQ